MDDREHRDVARLARACGIVGVGSAACIATYFAVGGAFGTLNDLGNASIGILSAGLAWRLRRHADGAATAATGAALTGAAVIVAGTALVVSGMTGWFLAGLVSSLGFAGVGAWLVVINGREGVVTRRGLRRLGILTGVLMLIGLAAAPGIVAGLDSAETAPGWAWLGFTGWLGTYLAYPAWAIWLSRVERGLASKAAATPARALAADGRTAA